VDPSPNMSEDQETPPSAPAERSGRRPFWTRGRIVTAAVLAMFVLLGAGYYATSQPVFCGSCHEMRLRSADWKRGAHVTVACVRCHQPPRTWYEFPLAVIDRARLVGGDLYAHVTGDYTDPVDERSAGTAPMSDAVCLQCHDVNRKATSAFRIIINHPEHAKRNGSCVSCHVRTGHPLPTRSTALSLMGQCFTCHGLTRASKAPGRCDLCHPAGYRLRPASHQARWVKRHAPVAKADRRQCEMCHQESFCTDCHGLQIPHPAGWSRGATGHAIYAKRDRAICTKCHTDKPDMCAMCHHKDWDPAKGTWVKQHFLAVEKQGTVYCITECHSPVFCSRCHVNEPRALSQ
jgi:nitrate/TMAO reductase-like tetraheme cytochrome c subunit